MKKFFTFALIFAAFSLVACGGEQKKDDKVNTECTGDCANCPVEDCDKAKCEKCTGECDKEKCQGECHEAKCADCKGECKEGKCEDCKGECKEGECADCKGECDKEACLEKECCEK